MSPLTIYVGYDRDEQDAYDVCVKSLLRRTSAPLKIVRLDLLACRETGLFTRRSTYRDGKRVDLEDGKPFSTDFSFTRFLIPALSLYQGWALFCDCDFLFTADIAGLFEYADDRFAAMCVKHPEYQPAEETKMRGQPQSAYRRKNWSSLVLWNCGHSANRVLTPAAVNSMAGFWLHGFDWLRDRFIGELPRTWNWLSGVSEPLEDPTDYPCGVHFTLGVPAREGHEDVPHAALWLAERDSHRVGNGRSLPTEYLRARGDGNGTIRTNAGIGC